MALDYSGANNGLFRHLGKVVFHYNDYRTQSQTLVTDEDSIIEAINNMTIGDPNFVIDGFDSVCATWRTNVTTRRANLLALAVKRLQDKTSVLDEIGAVTTDLAEILRKLVTQMRQDSETVLKSTVTIGAPTYNASNTGDGAILTTALLDGVTSPGVGAIGTFPAHADYRNRLSQLAVESETLRAICTIDSFSDSAAEGAETFVIEGRKMDLLHGFSEEGSGEVGAVQVVNGQDAIVNNGDFESWSATVPASWDLIAGTAGIHLLQETTAANVYHGTSSMQFKGDGVQASVEVSQAALNALLTANKMMVVTFRVKAETGISSGDLFVGFEGTGYVAQASEKVEITPPSFPTAWTLKHFFVIMPDIIPDDFKLVIRYDDTPENAKSVWIDDLAFGSVTYGAGIGYAIVRGATPWVRNDRMELTLANNDDGEFQKFARLALGIQLPSDSTGAETIADALIVT